MVESIINYLHLLATVVWIGGTIYITFILHPSLKAIDAQQSGKLQGIVAKKFTVTAWSSIVILIITGFLKTPGSFLFDPSSEIGMTLLIKHVLIICGIIVGLTIALYLIPNMKKNMPKPGEALSADFLKYSKLLKIFGSINLLIGLVIVWLAKQLFV